MTSVRPFRRETDNLGNVRYTYGAPVWTGEDSVMSLEVAMALIDRELLDCSLWLDEEPVYHSSFVRRAAA